MGKATDQYAEEKRWVFSFDLKEEREEKCLTERGRDFQITGPMSSKDLPPRVLMSILGTRNILVSEAERREREGE